MKLTPLIALTFIPVSFCNAISPDEKEITDFLAPCMNIQHSPEVISCLIDLYDSKKKEYQSEYSRYLQSIKKSKEASDKKSELIRLERKAKEGWDKYTTNHFLSGVIFHEKDPYGYNAKYYICLTENLSKRSNYYREKKLQ